MKEKERWKLINYLDEQREEILTRLEVDKVTSRWYETVGHGDDGVNPSFIHLMCSHEALRKENWDLKQYIAVLVSKLQGD